MSKTVLVLVETLHDYLPILEDLGYRLILATTPLEPRRPSSVKARESTQC